MRTDRIMNAYYRRTLEKLNLPDMPVVLPADTAPCSRYPELLFLGAVSVHFFIADPWLFTAGICPFFRIIL